MYDSVTPGSIPASATMVAGYADGKYANLTAMRARFPHARVVSIAVRYTTRAQVLDVETGDATPAQAVLWCTQTMADTANGELTVYCNTSTWPQVRAAFKTAGVSEPQYWIAHYDNIAALPAGAIAKQYQNTAGWDRSVVADHWPGIDPDPEDPVALTADEIKQIAAASAAATWAYQVDDATRAGVQYVTTKAQLWDAAAAAAHADSATQTLVARLGALQAAVAALAASGGITAAQVQAAAEAGAQAALAELGKDLQSGGTA
jgi:hypothetical protein